MHWFQDYGRQRSRILYAFRSPSGTRVGRDAIDPGLMRQLEAPNPGIALRLEGRARRPAGDRAVDRAPPAPAEAGRGGEGRPAAAPGARAEARAGGRRRPRRPGRRFRRPSKGTTPTTGSPSCSTGIRSCESASSAAPRIPERQAALLSLAERMNPAEWPPEEIETSCRRPARRSSGCRTCSPAAAAARAAGPATRRRQRRRPRDTARGVATS